MFINKLLKNSILIICVCFWSYGQKHTFSLNTGLRYFFDKDTPVVVTNKKTSFIEELFILNSGFTYSYKIKNSYIGLDVNFFYNDYKRNESAIPSPSIKNFGTFQLYYSRKFKSFDKIDIYWKTGLVYRHGAETVIIARIPLFQDYYELIIEDSRLRNFGLVAGLNMHYNLNSRWFLSSDLDFTGFFYMHDTERLKEVYNITKYPSRFDLNFKLGIGRKFSK